MASQVHTILVQGTYRNREFSVCFKRDEKSWIAEVIVDRLWPVEFRVSRQRPGQEVALRLVRDVLGIKPAKRHERQILKLVKGE